MTAEKIKLLMKSLNITNYESGVRIPQIRAILLTTTQAILPYRDEMTFDITNQLLKIKQYDEKKISYKLDEDFVMYEKCLFWGKSASNSAGIIPTKDYSVFVLNKSTGAIEKRYDITNAGKNFIDLDTVPEINKETQILLIMKTAEYPTAIRAFNNKFVFLKLIPMTENKYDLYLDMNQILGIELNSPKVGSV